MWHFFSLEKLGIGTFTRPRYKLNRPISVRVLKITIYIFIWWIDWCFGRWYDWRLYTRADSTLCILYIATRDEREKFFFISHMSYELTRTVIFGWNIALETKECNTYWNFVHVHSLISLMSTNGRITAL